MTAAQTCCVTATPSNRVVGRGRSSDTSPNATGKRKFFTLMTNKKTAASGSIKMGWSLASVAQHVDRLSVQLGKGSM